MATEELADVLDSLGDFLKDWDLTGDYSESNLADIITALRKSNPPCLHDAYRLARAAHAECYGKEPALRGAYAWVLYDCLKRYGDPTSRFHNDLGAFLKTLDAIRPLTIGDWDAALFCEMLRKKVCVAGWGLRKAGNVSGLKSLLAAVTGPDCWTALRHPDVRTMFYASLKDDPRSVINLVRWYGLDKLEPSDFSTRCVDGKLCPSDAQQLTKAYLDALLASDKNGGQIATAEERSEGAKEVAELLEDGRCKDWLWESYALGNLLVSLGRGAEARPRLASVVAKKPREEWAWRRYAATWERESPEKYRVCMAKARTLALSGRRASAEERRLAAAAYDVLAEELPKTDFYVEWKDEKKGLAGLVIPKEGSASSMDFLSFARRVKVGEAIARQVQAGACYRGHRAPDGDGIVGKVAACPDSPIAKRTVRNFSGELDLVRDFAFVRAAIGSIWVSPKALKELGGDRELVQCQRVTGTCRMMYRQNQKKWEWELSDIGIDDREPLRSSTSSFAGVLEKNRKGFGFVNDCFVPPEMINTLGLLNGEAVSGTAERKWDKKYGRWGWAATSIERAKSPRPDDGDGAEDSRPANGDSVGDGR